ncbi:MAG: carboxypeptidase-like regulatory domain-containing protein, partial [Muribaculaceae bacterium]|nr:carboxypeptidase-like regulatory domain-containing protein [Muribaculaceae bacterium]MBR5436118.1 carboxypeptidase-like regulatory domain-containing protein [Muribaculaceae bacterium]
MFNKWSLVVFCCLICLGNGASAQIWGTVRDSKTGERLESVAVSLCNLNDSIIVAGTITNKEGEFFFDAKPDGRVLRLSSVGYKTEWITAFSRIDAMIVPVEHTLSEVGITAWRITQTEKGFVVNFIDKDLSAGKNAVELLNHIPTVTFSEDRIEVLGMGVSAFYVDNRKISTIDEVKNLRGDEISRIEIDYLSGVDNRLSN